MTDISNNTQITQSEGNTNPRFRKVCFTLNNYSEEEYTQLLQDFATYKYVIGKEIGEELTPHLQGYVEFGRQLSLKQLKKINNRMHIEKTRGTREQNKIYCKKDGDYVCTFPLTIKERILRDEYKDVVWRPFQQTVLDICRSDPDRRTINWIWDEKGNIGKSYLCTYLYLKYDAVICGGKRDDVFNQVFNWIDNRDEESPKIVICDIPRASLDYVNYSLLEKLKDGLFYSGKYEGGVCLLEPLHIICMANEEPMTGMVSEDRWNVVKV